MKLATAPSLTQSITPETLQLSISRFDILVSKRIDFAKDSGSVALT
jgi:hypothetical protein